MPLKRKDGTPYRAFSEPNPLTKDQDQWSPHDENVVLHNISGKPTDPPPGEVPAPSTPEPEKKPEPKPEPPPEPPKPDPPKPEPEPPATDKLMEEHGIRSWCLPVAENNGHGLIWGHKFWFDCLVVEYLPYQIVIWTADDKVNLGSVVFPSRYVKTQGSVMMYRWWRVVKEQPYGNGRILRAIPSTFAPDFSS